MSSIIPKKSRKNNITSLIEYSIKPPFGPGPLPNGQYWTPPPSVLAHLIPKELKHKIEEIQTSVLLEVSKSKPLEYIPSEIYQNFPLKKRKIEYDTLAQETISENHNDTPYRPFDAPIRKWNSESEKIFPIRDPQNPLQVLPFLADSTDPTKLSDDIKVIFEYGLSIPERAIKHLKNTPRFEKMSDQKIEEYINNHTEIFIQNIINNSKNYAIYSVDTVSKNAEKALQGQQGLFIKKDTLQEGTIICPFAGTYADKEADFPNEENYAFQTMKDEYVISPSPSEQAGYAANTAFKLKDNGSLYHNQEGIPEYDVHYINACFIEKWVTFEKEKEDKKIIPLVFILHLGSKKTHTKDDKIEVRVDYGDAYPELMYHKDTTRKPTDKKPRISVNKGIPKKQDAKNVYFSWKENYEKLKEYKDKTDGFQGMWNIDNALYKFYNLNYNWYKNFDENTIHSDKDLQRYNDLKKLNFEKEKKYKTYGENYQKLKEYKDKTGGFQGMSYIDNTLYRFYQVNCNWYKSFDENTIHSGKDLQRYNDFKKLGFDTLNTAKHTTYAENYQKLKEYKNNHGDFKSLKRNDNSGLYQFLQREISFYKENSPKADNSEKNNKRYDDLKKLGFDALVYYFNV